LRQPGSSRIAFIPPYPHARTIYPGARWLGAFILSFFGLAQSAPGADFVRSGGPYVPTPQPVVDRMLDLAGVSERDYVIDLGSGDGRIVLTAAGRYRARGKGVDIDPELVEQSRREAVRRGVDRLATFERGDALETRVDRATVLTLYLLPELMHLLRDRIYRELAPGARVVSHDFRFIDWMPDRTVTLDVENKYGSRGAWQSTLYLWVVPAKVAGRWTAVLSGETAEEITLSFTQAFQRITGHAFVNETRVPLEGARLEGNEIRFAIAGTPDHPARREFSGTVAGSTIEGQVASDDNIVFWRAAHGSHGAVPAVRSALP
jgi:ubiquinone/menaquinone biosynthesis C-methylase UbiE